VSKAGMILTLAALLTASGAMADVFNMGPELTSLVLVPVGDPDEVPNVEPGEGGYFRLGCVVAYAYSIGKYEVTNAQYTEFLNAVAAVGDPKSLYSPAMAAAYGGITRAGSGTAADPWHYGPKDGNPNWLNRPVNYVSWGDAIRFTNWLHNGQLAGAQDATTTEDGAYAMASWEPPLNPYGDPSPFWGIPRNPGARFFLPTTFEWRKAAYYEPKEHCYYGYPTGRPINGVYPPFAPAFPPDPVPPEQDNGHSANCCGYWTPGGQLEVDPISPYGTTEVGAYKLSGSSVGTFDQAGNVCEWTETPCGGGPVILGGSWSTLVDDTFAGTQNEIYATDECYGVGFRVAAIPEPAAISLLALGGLAMIRRRRN